jgi:hypothetical protein
MCLRWLTYSATIAILIIGACALSACSSRGIAPAPNPPLPMKPSATHSSRAPSGIYGTIAAARGNAPALPPSYQCVRVYDASGQKPVANGMCSGPLGSFEVPLSPGTYLVEIGGQWKSTNGKVHFQPNRQQIVIGPNQWIRLGAHPPPGPVP